MNSIEMYKIDTLLDVCESSLSRFDFHLIRYNRLMKMKIKMSIALRLRPWLYFNNKFIHRKCQVDIKVMEEFEKAIGCNKISSLALKKLFTGNLNED